jgi:hypothetical protein
VVKEFYLRKIRTFIDGLIETFGPISFALALPNSDDATNPSLTLFISSKWTENVSIKESITKIISYMRDQNDDILIELVSRISIISQTDKVSKVFKAIGVTGSINPIYNCMFDNIIVKEAYLFENNARSA